MFKKLLLLLFTSCVTVNALSFTVASYNVENLFDYKYDGSEYDEFIPNKSKYWTYKKYEQKLNNVAKVLNDLNTHIIALQEIENEYVLKELLKKTPQYKYWAFNKKPKSAVGLALISKFPIIDQTVIQVEKFNDFSRNIFQTTLNIENKKFTIFNNHWKSKREGENTRIPYAYSLMKYLKKSKINHDYIFVGDFNSNYNEYETFKFNDKLNTTSGITGINHILNTIQKDKYVTKETIFNQKYLHFNTWLDLPYNKRFSYIFRNTKETPDNIILSAYLFDKKDISYLYSSLKVFKPTYLVKNSKINRKEFSDHLPIIAEFSDIPMKNQNSNSNFVSDINSLYALDFVNKPIQINNATVIYKYKNNAILKQQNGRAVYLYGCAKDLQLKNMYNFRVLSIYRYNGLLEIKDIDNIKEITSNFSKTLFLDATKHDLFNEDFQNEIVTNLKGIYKNRYLHYSFNGTPKKIRIYTKDEVVLPNENQQIKIKTGHLSVYKSQIQIVLYKSSDWKYIK